MPSAILTPSVATVGTNRIFTADSAVFVTGDIGRIIMAGAGRATITGLGPSVGSSSSPNTIVRATITVAFASTAPIPVGHWQLSISLTPLATTGLLVRFTAQEPVFFTSDVGRYIIFGAGRALIKSLGPSAGASSSPNAIVLADIIDDFANTSPMPSGHWRLRLSPQTTLDVDKKGPVGASIGLTFGADAMRASDVGKFISIYGGLIKITSIQDRQHATGEILSELHDSTDADPAAAPAGSWSLRVPSWSDERGWPRTVEFHEGRLWFGGTRSQPTTIWGSRSNDFESFAIGSLADDAVEYTIANRSVNIIQWLRSLKQLFIGDAESEHSAKGKGADAPLGGDEIPYVVDQSDVGSMHVQPLVIQHTIISHQEYGRKVMEIEYDFNTDGYMAQNLMLYSRHLGDSPLLQHPLVYAKEPNSIIHAIRKDGQMPCLTIYKKEQVAGWTRFVTDGLIESVVSIPNEPDGHDDVVLFVNRTIDGETKRFLEAVVFPTDRSTAVAGRIWREYYTDCGLDGTLLANERIITGFEHLEGKDVDVILNGSFVGSFPVTDGEIDVGDSNIVDYDRTYEAGLHYDSLGQTMRPSIPNQSIDGLPRNWEPVFLRLVKSIGGRVNGKNLLYPQEILDGSRRLFSGDIKGHSVPAHGDDIDGYLTFEQRDPYPQNITALYGVLHVGDGP